MMIDWFEGIKLEINYFKFIILRDYKDDGVVDNNGEIRKEMFVFVGKIGSWGCVNIEEVNGLWELVLLWFVYLIDGL